MAARIFSVRLNLDEFNAGLAACDGDADRLDFLLGFQLGVAGGDRRDGWSAAKCAGWQVGESSRRTTLELQAAKSQAGKASAEARQRSNGTAQPSRTAPEHTSNTPRTDARTPSEQSNNPLIEESRDRRIEKSTDPERAGVDPAAVFASTPPADTDPRSQWNYERLSPWAKDLDAARCKIGAGNWQAWAGLIKEHTLPVVLSAAKQVPPQERWPDQTEAMIAKIGSQESIGDAVRRKTIRIVNDD